MKYYYIYPEKPNNVGESNAIKRDYVLTDENVRKIADEKYGKYHVVAIKVDETGRPHLVYNKPAKKNTVADSEGTPFPVDPPYEEEFGAYTEDECFAESCGCCENLGDSEGDEIDTSAVDDIFEPVLIELEKRFSPEEHLFLVNLNLSAAPGCDGYLASAKVYPIGSVASPFIQNFGEYYGITPVDALADLLLAIQKYE